MTQALPRTKQDRRADTGSSFRALGLVVDPAKIPAIKRGLMEQGVSAWARAHGFRPKSVHDVLTGKRACTRGESYRIAAALGLFHGFSQ